MSNNLVKSGYLHKFSKGMFGEKWKNVYCTLYRDGSFFWFKNKGDSTASGNVSLKNVCRFLTVGPNIRAIPYNPNLPSFGNIEHVIAFPAEPSKKSKIYFFLAENQNDMTSWMSAINSVLPDPAPMQAGGVAPNYQQQPQFTPPQGGYPSAPPPPYNPSHTSPGGGGGGGSAPPIGFMPMPQPGGSGAAPYPGGGGGYPQQAGGYPQQPPSGYPQQPPAGYQQPPAGYQQPPMGYQQPPAGYQQPPPAGYPQQQYAPYGQQPQGYHGAAPPQQQYYQQQPYKQKKKGSGYGKMAMGLAGGAVAGYAASKLFRPFGGGWGHGSWGSGSWGSGSWGSCGSFGS